MNILVSVIICTHNRASLLGKAIASLQAQDFPDDQYEIIVVDNASVDQTGQLVEQLRASSSVQLRYVYEARLGVSHARNSGLAAAQGGIVAYMDDDEEAAPHWLSGVVDTFANVTPRPGIVCGPVNPAWEQEPPDWLTEEFEGHLSLLRLESKPAFITNLNWFPEGNSAFSTELLRGIGGFSTDLGRKGKLLLSGECLMVYDKISALGLGVFYQPLMSVYHFIPAERMSLKWIAKRSYFQGISDVVHHLSTKRYDLAKRLWLALVYLVKMIPPLLATLRHSILRLRRRTNCRDMIKYARSRIEFSKRLGWFMGFVMRSLALDAA